jgi:hypothetical protein
LKSKQYPKCADAVIPVTVVFYKSNPNFKGQDSAIIELSFKPGEAAIRKLDIEVE